MATITVRIPDRLNQQLHRHMELTGERLSVVVRDAMVSYVGSGDRLADMQEALGEHDKRLSRLEELGGNDFT